MQHIDISKHTGLVARITRAYMASMPGLEFDDLFQEGMIGVWRASQLFDPTRGVKFSTFASHHIRQKINLFATTKTKDIHVPANVVAKARAAEKKARINQLKTGSYKMPQEIKVLRDVRAFSMDDVVNNKDSQGLGHETIGKDDPRIANFMQYRDKKYVLVLGDALVNTSKMNFREWQAIKMYFGLTEDGVEYTYADIGQKFNNVSRQRVEQLIKNGLRKIRVHIGDKIKKGSLLED